MHKSPKNLKAKTPFTLNKLQAGIAILVFTFLLYGNTLTFDYALDDAIVITGNEFTKQGFSGIKDLFTKDSFHGFFGEAGKDKLVKGGRYRPLTMVMFAIEQGIFGNQAFIHHLINILLYALTGFFIFLTLLHLVNFPKKKETVFWISFSAALLFIAHPIHTEAVANIKGRDEIMALLGSLGALYLLSKANFDKLSPLQLMFACLSFFVGLLSKENAITFVAVIPLTAYLVFNHSLIKSITISIPFLATAILFLILRTAVIGWDMGAAPSMELMNNPYLKIVDNRYVPYSGAEKLATISFTLWKYIQLLVFPHPLTHDYYPNHISVKTFSNPLSILGLLSYLSLILFSIWGVLKKVKWTILPAYYIITISIVSNIFFPVGTHMSERFIYMPSLAFSIGTALILWHKTWFGKDKISMALLALLLISYSVKTVMRNPVWKNNYALFTTDALTSVKSAKVNNAAGGVILDHISDMPEGPDKNKEIERAHVFLSNAIKEHPNYVNAYLLKGNAFFYQNKFNEAAQYFQTCQRIDPSHQESAENLFLTYRSAGRYYGEKENNLSLSLDYLQKALALRPQDFETNRLLGTCYGIMGQHQNAIQYFRKCTELQPENAGVYQSLGQAYELSGNAEAAQQAYLKSQSLNSN